MNEPYYRVTDSTVNGAINGFAVGMTGLMAADIGLKEMKQTAKSATIKNNMGSVNIDPKVLAGLSKKQRESMGINTMETTTVPSRANVAHKKIFGSGGNWRRAAAYGVAGLASSAIGVGIDSMNK